MTKCKFNASCPTTSCKGGVMLNVQCAVASLSGRLFVCFSSWLLFVQRKGWDSHGASVSKNKTQITKQASISPGYYFTVAHY